MMTMTMRGADGNAETSDYSTLSEAACALIPACVAWKAAGGVLSDTAGAAGTVVDESLQKAQQAATQVMAPTLAQLQRLESTITWAAVGTVVALGLATGSVIYFTATRRR